MDLIHVPGKRNRKVPILLTPDVRLAMKLLSDTRTVCGVPQENKYFFATNSSCGHFHSWLVLNRVAGFAGCEKPQLVTSTRLRKYVATLAQVPVCTASQSACYLLTTGYSVSYNVHYSLTVVSQLCTVNAAAVVGNIDLTESMIFQPLPSI